MIREQDQFQFDSDADITEYSPEAAFINWELQRTRKQITLVKGLRENIKVIKRTREQFRRLMMSSQTECVDLRKALTFVGAEDAGKDGIISAMWTDFQLAKKELACWKKRALWTFVVANVATLIAIIGWMV